MPDYRLTFIVPYRDRKNHLQRFIPHYRKLFPDSKILVVEQDDTKAFNRAKLLNIGFLHCYRETDAVCLQDVDTLAIAGKVDLSFPDKPTHLGTHIESFGWRLPYNTYWSGSNLLSVGQMWSVNGFYNDYYGWGGEDDCFRRSFVERNIPIQSREGWFKSLPHMRPRLDTQLRANMLETLKKPRDFSNGLSSCQYTLNSTEEQDGYTLLKVVL
ncbi:MAG: hypothetical protein BGO69_01780 [Bacteroidetes bacterium 46-16]|nr:MAG: hypothetical protein BGO69_01780 [Bacteroidetes bacterium 46-16]